jgi:hypothetical protein
MAYYLLQEIGDKIIKELEEGWEKGHHNDYYMDV